MTRDPLGYVDGGNRYRYAMNNPVAKRDPLGLATLPCALSGSCGSVNPPPPPVVGPAPPAVDACVAEAERPDGTFVLDRCTSCCTIKSLIAIQQCLVTYVNRMVNCRNSETLYLHMVCMVAASVEYGLCMGNAQAAENTCIQDCMNRAFDEGPHIPPYDPSNPPGDPDDPEWWLHHCSEWSNGVPDCLACCTYRFMAAIRRAQERLGRELGTCGANQACRLQKYQNYQEAVLTARSSRESCFKECYRAFRLPGLPGSGTGWE